jgi:hypothetical protein
MGKGKYRKSLENDRLCSSWGIPTSIRGSDFGS